MAVADLAADFYLETVDLVFQRYALPKGELTYKGRAVNPAAIRRTALITNEGAARCWALRRLQRQALAEPHLPGGAGRDPHLAMTA